MGGSAPKQDPNMGRAALLSAQTGQDMLAFMKGQAETTNAWAAEDRARDLTVFRPLQDQFIADARAWDSPERRAARGAEASADVGVAAAAAAGARRRDAMARGVDPSSGQYQAMEAKAGMDTALAQAGAVNLARRGVEAEGVSRTGAAIGLGAGLGVNPLSAMSAGSGAVQAGGSAAMQGYNQQASILNQDYQNRYNAWSANTGGMFGALGAVAGALPWASMLSSKEAKTDKAEPKGVLRAVEEMPVDTWRYKEGMGPPGTHIGPYAEDMQRITGMGDGKTIALSDMTGMALGAVKELAAKVAQLENAITPRATAKAA
jgi:hypothetical protein